jgi:hypothetical protein
MRYAIYKPLELTVIWVTVVVDNIVKNGIDEESIVEKVPSLLVVLIRGKSDQREMTVVA